MARRKKEAAWTVVREYKNLCSPAECIVTIIRRHIKLASISTTEAD
jgi:hypothetical protein